MTKSMLCKKVAPVAKFNDEHDGANTINIHKTQPKMKNFDGGSVENIRQTKPDGSHRAGYGGEPRNQNKIKKQLNNLGQKAKKSIQTRPTTSQLYKTSAHRPQEEDFYQDQLPEELDNFHDATDHEVAALNMKMQIYNEDDDRQMDAGSNLDHDFELFKQLQQLKDLDQSQLDDEQLE